MHFDIQWLSFFVKNQAVNILNTLNSLFAIRCSFRCMYHKYFWLDR